MTQGTSSARDRLATKRDLLRLVRSAIARGDLAPEAEQETVERLGTLVRRFALTRRDLLKATAATAGLTLIATEAAARLGWASSAAEAKSLAVSTPSLTASVLRRDDMLALRFDLYNLVRNQQGVLVRQNAAQSAYIVVSPGYGADNAPQNIAEQAFLEKDDNGTPAETDPIAQPGDVKALLAGRTRLAFRVPDAVTSIPFALSSLLDFTRFQPSVVPVALPPNPDPSLKPTIREPNETETAIEMPWHLILSPHVNSAWAHAAAPVVRNGRTELWHTRLAAKGPGGAVDEVKTDLRTVRAVWTNGFDRNNPPPTPPPDPGFEPPFRMSLSGQDRWKLVSESADYNIPNDPNDPSKGIYAPHPIQVERLMLSALGGWQNTRGNFAPLPKLYDLLEWRHIATMGRDQYVRVVYAGYWLPIKHPAVLIKVTERKLFPVPPNNTDRAAYLRQRFFIVTRQPILSYPDAAPQPNGGREFPYKTIEVKTLVTPTLEDPHTAAYAFKRTSDNTSFQDHAFFPVVGGKLFPISLVGTDRDGLRSEFTMPLVFVSVTDKTFPFTDADIQDVVTQYDAGTFPTGVTADPRVAELGGQKVGMAKSVKPGDTAIEAKSLKFGAVPPTDPSLLGLDEAPFFPIWTEAEVRLNGVEQVKGGNPLSQVKIAPHEDFVTGGFGAANNNPGDVFAKVTTTVDLSFVAEGNGDRSGGLINPDMSIKGLSRTLGPVGGSVSPMPQDFDPTKFFPAGAKILGGISLGDIIDSVPSFGDANKIPKLNTRTVYPDGDTTQPPQSVETTFNFVPKLKADPFGIFDPTTDNATMTIDARFLTPIDPPAEPTYEIVGDLRNFRVTMLGTVDPMVPFIMLRFNQLKFTTKNGKKPNVDVDINEVQFVGVLAFVNTLKDYLKLGNTGPSIDIQPSAVTAGFSIPIPTVGVGVLTIQNIAFGAALTIPFTGKPARVRFNFSEREDPFLVTVIGLGGGGFFAIALGLDGMEMFEMSIEVGASVALDLGVASGEVHALAGMYYKLERIAATATDPEHDDASLTGYVRLGGSVNVLGIASVSVEFYLGLKYEFEPDNELWGQATLTVEVEVLMFSESFEFSVERRIAGGSSSAALPAPLFASGGMAPRMASLAPKTTTGFNYTDLVSHDEWNAYVGAFAAVS